MAETKTRKRPKKAQAPEKLLEAIKLGELDPVYYFYAADRAMRGADRTRQSPFNDYLLDIALDGIRLNVVDGNTRDLNYGMFIGGETPMEQVIDLASTYPMMRPKRLVIAKDAHNFRSADWQAALRYLENPAPTSVLVFVGEHMPTQNKGGEAARQAVLNSATCVRFAPFTRQREVEPFLRAELKRRKLKMGPAAEQMLFDLVGVDLNELLQALEKLDLFSVESREVKPSDIEQCVAHTRVQEIWDLQDGLADRKLGLALKSLGNILENAKPDDYMRLLSSLIRMYRELIAIRRRMDTGESPASLMQNYPGNPFRVKKLVEQARRNQTAQLVVTVHELARLDREFRSSRVPNNTLFERFVMKACGAPIKR